MYKYLFFDLDGTLTDSHEGITKSVSYALVNLGYKEPENLDDLFCFIGPPLKDSFMKYYDMDEATATEAVRIYRERYSVTGLYENWPYEGIPELLSKLKKEGRVLIIASSKPTAFVLNILNKFELREYFDIVSGADFAGLKGEKEDVIKEALKQLEISQDKLKEVVMIGDRHYDINGAKFFGIDSIGVNYGFKQSENELEEAGATYVVDTVEELAKLFERV